MAEIQQSRAILIGSPTLNRQVFPDTADFLCYMKGLKPKGKIGVSFGSFGWSGEGPKAIHQDMEATGIEVVEPDLAIKWVPDSEELDRCMELGMRMADHIKQSTPKDEVS